MFSREKAPAVSLPSPPNIREILEDIESCQKTDPVFDLAQHLSRKKGKHSPTNSGGSRLENIRNKTGGRESLTPTEADESPASVSKSSGHKKSNKKKSSKRGAIPISSSQHDATYTNIIQFTTVCDQTTELISEIEPMLKKLDIDISEFLASLDISESDEQQNVKNDSDNDNKLL